MLVWETIRFVAIDFAWGVIRFPVWWYTAGFLKVVNHLSLQAGVLAKSLNIKILSRYLLKPMFGQYDIWGRIISFIMRIVQFVILIIIASVYTLTMVILAILWLLLPLFIVYNIVFHLQLIPALSESYYSFLS